MRILAGVRKKLGGYESSMKSVARLDVAAVGTIDRQVHLSLRSERANHLCDFLQEIPEVHAVAVDGSRQGLVEFRRDLDARVDIVEQHANLLCRIGSATLGNRVALKANGATQAGQVVRYPVIGLSQSDTIMFDQN